MKHFRFFSPSAAVVVALAPSVGLARDSAASDVKCLLLSNQVVSSANEPAVKEAASSTQLFYLGRVSKLSETQIKAGLRSFPKQMDAGTAGRMMNQCAQATRENGRNVEAIIRKTKI